MCGRFSLGVSASAITEAFQLSEEPDWNPRYNIAPTQTIPALLYAPGQPEWQFRLLHWGLIPSWAKDRTIAAKLINARAETIAEKPSFRSAFKHRRCLILADGFYEWQRVNSKKQPFYFHKRDRQPFAFAGLWEHWQGESGAIASCTIVTTQANELLEPIHDRMPVILPSEEYATWLDPSATSNQLQTLLHPYAAEAMAGYPVSPLVNRATYESPECINSL